METVANKNPQAAVKAETKPAEKTAEQKAAKAEAAKRFKERRAEEAKAAIEGAKRALKWIEEKKVQCPAEVLDYLQKQANPVTRTAGGTNSLFNKIFGDSPKVGDSVTLMDIFNKTLKSKADFDRQVKELAKKGTIIEFTAAPEMVKSTYTIKALAK